MPNCGSQITICDIPIRFDTYFGCAHACSYCFAQRKIDISNIKNFESAEALRGFIGGARNNVTNWCDWDIPLHWGGMSDPFQPIEKVRKRSLECLKVFAETQYPFVVSTKNKMLAEGEYFELIKQCNCVVQFSAACKKYDEFEQGASSYEERVAAAKKISKYKRVIIRVQPYIPAYFNDIIESLNDFKDAGVHGCVFEAMKYQYKEKGTIKLRNDFVFPTDLLKQHFTDLKNRCHHLGMKFYCGENRLRKMGDELCCCGIEGLGWKPNTANLNHYLFDRGGYRFTRRMREAGTCEPFCATHQTTLARTALRKMSFKQVMDVVVKNKDYLLQLLPDEYREKYKKK